MDTSLGQILSDDVKFRYFLALNCIYHTEKGKNGSGIIFMQRKDRSDEMSGENQIGSETFYNCQILYKLYN